MEVVVKHVRLIVVTAAVATFAVAFLLGDLANAATITVKSTSSVSGGHICTLRDAIRAANTDASTGGCPAGHGSDTINLAARGVYTLTDLDNVTRHLGLPQPNGLPSISSEVTINGNAATITRSRATGTPGFRLLHVAGSGHLTVSDLTLANGQIPNICVGGACVLSGGEGGAILNEGTLSLTNVTVTANGAGVLTVIGAAETGDRAASGGGGINNAAGATLTLTNSTVSNNSAGESDDGLPGGGIFNAGSMTLVHSSVIGNEAGGGEDFGGVGGGIANSGSATLTDSTVAGNTGGGGSYGGPGGGLFNSGTMTLIRCTVRGNFGGSGDSGGNGGGIANGEGAFPYARPGGTLTLVNSTITGNMAGEGGGAGGDGGGIFNSGLLTLASSTISGNHTGSGNLAQQTGNGGGIANVGAAMVRNTLVAGNSTNPLDRGCHAQIAEDVTCDYRADPRAAPSSDCYGTLTSQGYNLIENLGGCTFTDDTTGTITNLDPHLGPLQDNGGPTLTQALLSGSPAIDAANPRGCTGADVSILMTDQRGAPRVAGDGRCDIGAYEATLPAWATITPTRTGTPTPSPTPPPTPTPRPTRVPTPEACERDACLWVGPGIGTPGARVSFTVTLSPAGTSIAAAQADIAFGPAARIAATAQGTPDCAVNPVIRKGATSFAFLPNRCSPGVDCQGVRAIVMAFDNSDAILSDAVLYNCTVAIANNASPGHYALTMSNAAASAPTGDPKHVTAVGGEILVEAAPLGGTPVQIDRPGGACNIATARKSDHDIGLLLLWPITLWRRREGRTIIPAD
jgi:hypothetical protein